MNDIKTLLVTSFFLVAGGGLLFFLKNRNEDENCDETMIENDKDNLKNNDNYFTRNAYDSEELVKPKTKTILQTKTKKNKTKQSLSKKRYY
jgi:hypothetical protein